VSASINPDSVVNGSEPSSNDRVALIIDDDDSIRVLSHWVAQRAGHVALTARDGPEGLELYRREAHRIGLILLDLTMPRMTGAEVVAELHKINANVPIVLVTGYGEDAVRDEEKIGVSGVLQKPFTPDALRALLDRYLRKAPVSS
jgi:CheY-like chemotaxis protein